MVRCQTSRNFSVQFCIRPDFLWGINACHEVSTLYLTPFYVDLRVTAIFQEHLRLENRFYVF